MRNFTFALLLLLPVIAPAQTSIASSTEQIMMNRRTYGLLFLILSGSLIGGGAAQTSNKEIRELLKTFSEDVGPKGEEAWRKLRAYSDSQLIKELEALESSASPSDQIRPQIAFVFCWIGRDCAKNVSVIEAALSKSSPYQNFYADDAESMLSRLIERGNKALLKPLFESATWSDGALSEELTDTFAKELQKDPEQFLRLLSTCPPHTRKTVYWLIAVDGFDDKELIVLRKRLSSIPKTSQVYKTARELLAALNSKARPA